MQKLLRDLWATLRAWLAGQFMDEPPVVPPVEPEDEDPLYHTMDGGGETEERKNGRTVERGNA